MTSKPRPFTERDVAIGNVVIRWMSAANTWLFRATGGKVGASFLGGARVLLLTTIGRKSGLPRTTPLIYIEAGDDLAIVASKGGMDHHPLWYHNLVAQPDVEVQIGSDVKKLRARTATEDERAALWPRLVATYKYYQSYQDRTDRQIPVVVLSPR